MAWNSTSEAEITTTDNTAVVVFTRAQIMGFGYPKNIVIKNDGAANGMFSLNAGQTWAFFSKNYETQRNDVLIEDVRVKRVTDGDNLAGIYIEVW